MSRDVLPPGFREAVFRRAGHRCERCGTHASLTLSHRIARSRGGPWAHWNINGLCQRCHMWCEEHPEAAEREGWRIAGSIVRGRYVGPDATARFKIEQGIWPLDGEAEEVYVPRLDGATWLPRSWERG